MALVDELAVKLSEDVYRAMEASGDERLHERVAKSIGAMSPGLEEAFMTAMRLRFAEKRGRQFLASELKRLAAQQNA